MLGKNRLTTIENLEGLGRLDVLDLHSNQIACVEKLTHLSALRVLNLAGNRISRLEGVEGLVSLTELNLRRNVLSSMDALHGLVSLQRMFLSHNQLPSLGAVEPLRAVPQLVELSVEHNPLCTEQVVVGGPSPSAANPPGATARQSGGRGAQPRGRCGARRAGGAAYLLRPIRTERAVDLVVAVHVRLAQPDVRAQDHLRIK